MPVLLSPQQIAGATQFQIQRRDLEPRAQIGKLAQRRQTFARDFGQLRVGRDQ